ncbi:MAG TPA: hypothetical protein PLC65_09365 [Bacteroidia bacterium]|nr:hypothetical protein [Bacteroidia bacterium]
MKTLIQIIIVGMFGVELCSPFFISYMDNKAKRIKASTEYFNARNKKEQMAQNKLANVSKNWKNIDYEGEVYADSKSLQIKE